MRTNRTSRRVSFGSLAVAGLTASLVAGAQAGAGAAPPVERVSGLGFASVGRDNIILSLSVSDGGHVAGSLAYYDGHRWLTSTHVGSLTVSGRVAKVKGEGRWAGRNIIYYVQVRDRSPKRTDTFSIKAKDGKQVVLRQSVALTGGDLRVTDS